MLALYIILGIIAAFIIVLAVRAAAFNPKEVKPQPAEEIAFDRDASVETLRQLIRCKTVSYPDHSLEDDSEFEKLVGLLPSLYPEVFASCELKRFPGRALLFKWKGKNPGPSAVMMAHYDVVPVNEADWDKPPFEGIIEDGILYGRGSLDTKISFNGVLFAANELIGKGFVPEHDIYFAFSGGEEINGPGARNIVEWFKQQGTELSIVLDEGGAVVDKIFPGVKKPCAAVGIAEKGQVNLIYTVSSSGGHASAPPMHTPIGKLAKAVANVEKHPAKSRFCLPVRLMFDTLGRYASFGFKLIYGNMWCFSGLLGRLSSRLGGELNAMLRTTVAFTMSSGSDVPNVIPPQASVISNSRIIPGDTVSSVTEYFTKKAGSGVKVELYNPDNAFEPSRISTVDCDGFRKLSASINEVWPEAVVTPYIMMQCSDSREYGPISDKVFRFSAMDLTKEERATIHGNNEHVRTETVHRCTSFYIRLLSRL